MAKILYFDIETAPNTGYSWGKWEQNIIEFTQEGYLLCYAYAWNDSKVKVVSLADFDGYTPHSTDDKALTQSLWELFNEADVIIAHNGKQFDIKYSNARFLKHGLVPPSAYQVVDTLLIARNKFKLNSNKLDDLGKILNLGRKVETGGFDLWLGCMRGDMPSWAKMKKYNCITTDHKLLSKDLRWRTPKELRVGDEVLGFDENGKGRKYREAIIESITYDVAPIYKVTLESGKTFRVTSDHKWLVVNWIHDRVGSYIWKTTDQLNKNRQDGIPKLMDVWEEIDSKEAGWLAGMYDGEGCLFNRKVGAGNSITITQKEGPELDKIIHLSNYFSGGKSTLMNGNYGTERLITKTVRVGGSCGDRLEFLGKVRPERLINKVDFNNFGRVESRKGIDLVVSVEPFGNEEIAVIKTSTSTFICDGYPMHNCQDVVLLREVYYRLRAWMNSHPNLNSLDGIIRPSCATCQSEHVQRKGTEVKNQSKVWRWKCMDCGANLYTTLKKEDELRPR